MTSQIRSTQPIPTVRKLLTRIIAILAIAILAAAVTVVVCSVVHKQYQATATDEVTLPPPTSGGISTANVDAASDLAGQYAQIATLRPTLEAAAAALHEGESRLQGNVSAGVIASQNLIGVTDSASIRAEAVRRANAVASALVKVAARSNVTSEHRYVAQLNAGLAVTNKQISQIRASESGVAGQSALGQSDAVELAGLLATKQTVEADIAQAVANEPSVQIAALASSASQTQPKTALYALLVFILTVAAAGWIGVRRLWSTDA